MDGYICLVISILIIFNLFFAVMMIKAANLKGYEDREDIAILIYCLIGGVLGALYVIALPDLKIQKQNDMIIHLLQNDNQMMQKNKQPHEKKEMKEKQIKNSQTQKIELFEMISADDYEFTITGYDFAKRVSSDNNYYEAKDKGHQYLDIILDYNNLADISISSNDIGDVKVRYNYLHEYTSFVVVDMGESLIKDTYINSFDRVTMHYLVDVPDEVANSMNSIIVYITISGKTYELEI